VTGTTAELNLATATDSDDIEVYNVTSLTANLNTLDALFSFTTGHDHSGAHLGKPVAAVASGAHLVSPVIDSGGLHVVSGQIYKADGAALLIGTTDAQSVQLITNNVGRLTIDLNGQVAIAQSLVVTGLTTLTGGVSGPLYRAPGAAFLVGTSDGQSLQLQTNSLGRLTIDLNGQATFANNVIVTGATTLTGGVVSPLYRTPGAAFVLGTSDGQSLQLQTNALGRLTVDLNGQVTIAQSLIVNGAAVVNGAGTTLGFNGVAGTVRPSPNGSRGGNAALASLLTALANLGLITDSTVV
jgi:hypothetical protein